jgi:hypothetical protein
VEGETVTAAIMNAHIRDNFNYLFASNGGQSFNSGTLSTSSTAYVTLGTFVAATAGRRCLWWFSTSAYCDGAVRRGWFKFRFNGGEVGVPATIVTAGGATDRMGVSNIYLNIPAASTHTFEIAYRVDGASSVVVAEGFYFIVVEA